jgi:hypothetical protein
MRHRSTAIPAAALTALAALLLATTAAFAGNWAQVTAKDVPVDPPAGEEATISLSLLQHGQTPVSWPRLTVIATEKTTGKVVSVQATASGAAGSYVAKITFPTEGQWTLSFTSQDLIMEGSATVSVAPPVVAPAAPASGSQAPATSAFDPMLPLLAVLGILAVLVVGVLTVRGRATPAGAQVSART